MQFQGSKRKPHKPMTIEVFFNRQQCTPFLPTCRITFFWFLNLQLRLWYQCGNDSAMTHVLGF